MLALLGYIALFLLELGTLGAIAYYVSHKEEREAARKAKTTTVPPVARATISVTPMPSQDAAQIPPAAH